ncbi:MAG: NADH-quinone oxidoreductase subunit A [Planctomycetota bacterium]|jgi:NADH-quinone oxidoreductase subunit A
MGAALNDYLPVLLTVVFAGGFAVLALVASALIGKKSKGNPTKDTPYECGMPIISEAHVRFSVKFYLVAMLFILFDIEVVFLYPWAVVFDDLPASLVFVEMLVFIAILFVGWLYMVKKGVLRWSKTE